jgi:hypothetical protein
MERKFCLIIGDGLTKDFVGKSLNTSNPFDAFKCEAIGEYYTFFFKYIKDIHDELHFLMWKRELESDFDAINFFSEINRGDIRKECQLRRYLALTYSSLQRELDKRSKSAWRWSKWLETFQDQISFIASFNYDLLMETTLKDLGIPHYRTGTNEKEAGVPLLKPHGSIDFDIEQPQYENLMQQASLAPAIWGNYFSLNQVNGIVQVIPSTHWLLPRVEADIIPPSQANYQRHLEWVNKGFDKYNDLSDEITDVIIIGHSYSECDRDEIDYFLERLKNGTKVHVVNPQLLKDLKTKIESLQLEYIAITDYHTMPN